MDEWCSSTPQFCTLSWFGLIHFNKIIVLILKKKKQTINITIVHVVISELQVRPICESKKNEMLLCFSMTHGGSIANLDTIGCQLWNYWITTRHVSSQQRLLQLSLAIQKVRPICESKKNELLLSFSMTHEGSITSGGATCILGGLGPFKIFIFFTI